MRSSIRDIISEHPMFDHILPLVFTLAWIKFGMNYAPDSIDVRHGIYTAQATLSGIALAASTFACSVTYQSADRLLSDLRKRYHHELRRNWTSVIMSCLFCALAPIVAMFLDSYSSQWAFTTVIYGLTILVARFTRSMWWLRLSLFVIGNSNRFDEAEAPELLSKRPDCDSGPCGFDPR